MSSTRQNILLWMLVTFSLISTVAVMSHSVWAQDLQLDCAKWLAGDQAQYSYEKRKEAAIECSRGATLDCVVWVMGDRFTGSYSNRQEAVQACSKPVWGQQP